MWKIFIILMIFSIPLNAHAQPVDHYFDSLKSVYNSEALFDKFQSYKKREGLISGLKNELKAIPDDTIRQIAAIAIFHNLYGYKWGESEALVEWVNAVAENSLNETIKNLAMDTKAYFVEGITGQQLIQISLPDHLGDTISTGQFKGKYLVIDLWATWCGPCVQEMKKIPDIRKKYNNLEFYSISFDDDYGKMQKFVKKKGYDWPVVFAGKDHPLWKYFRVSALPNYFIVDTDGKILATTIHEMEAMISRHVAGT